MFQRLLSHFYPGPRGFCWFFSAWESRERAAKRRTRVTKPRERKTSGYLGLESHFHADARVRIWPSASDWLIFLRTRKSIWLVSLIGNTEGTVGISVTALLVVGNKFGWFQWGFPSTFPGGKHSRKTTFKWKAEWKWIVIRTISRIYPALKN